MLELLYRAGTTLAGHRSDRGRSLPRPTFHRFTEL
jgi:hypothetical protein